MIIIEFFDSEPLENIVTCIKNLPDKIYILGNVPSIERQRTFLERFLYNRHNIKMPIELVEVDNNSLSSIYTAIEEIVLNNDDCHFDLTGGSDLTLVAMGRIFEKYADKKIQMHRFNIRQKQVIDCDMDGHTVNDHGLSISVKEHVELHGARIIYDSTGKRFATPNWDFSVPELTDEINDLWNINKAYAQEWNVMFSAIDAYYKCNTTPDRPAQSVDVSIHPNNIKQDLLNELVSAGFIKNLDVHGNHLSFNIKNKRVANIFKCAGTILELKMNVIINEMIADGELTDVRASVQIDWDGEIHTDYDSENYFYDTTNEIDLIAMDGIMPIFISCKNGNVQTEELYKLYTVAEKFGGKYVKKILVKGGEFGPDKEQRFIVQRARSHGIHLIEAVRNMTDLQIKQSLRNIL